MTATLTDYTGVAASSPPAIITVDVQCPLQPMFSLSSPVDFSTPVTYAVPEGPKVVPVSAVIDDIAGTSCGPFTTLQKVFHLDLVDGVTWVETTAVGYDLALNQMTIDTTDQTFVGNEVTFVNKIYYVDGMGAEIYLMDVDTYNIQFSDVCESATMEAYDNIVISVDFGSTPHLESVLDVGDSVGTLTGTFYHCLTRAYTATMLDGTTPAPSWL